MDEVPPSAALTAVVKQQMTDVVVVVVCCIHVMGKFRDWNFSFFLSFFLISIMTKTEIETSSFRIVIVAPV